MTSEDFNKYLEDINISEKDKDYVSSFFKKKEYIDMLNDTVIKAFNGETLISGSGNYNSKISIIIKDKADLKDVKTFISPIFDFMNTSLWNTYVTFYKKTDHDTNVIYDEMLRNEIYAINPSIIIHFSDKQTLFEEEFDTGKTKIQTININMDDIRYALNKDNFKSEKYNNIMQDIYGFAVKIIPYREIEILE